MLFHEADIYDTDDWSLTPECFSYLDKAFGPFSLDAFANYYNANCLRFYSLFYTPNALGVDAFSYSWEGENVLLVPPVLCVGRALHHLRLCQAKGTLVAPKWPSSHCWPLLLKEFRKFILEVKIFKGNKILRHGLNQKTLLGADFFQGEMLAVVLDYSHN